MSTDIIEIVDLTKRYGSQTAVDRLNLKIRRGEIYGLLGPNGAGKSTTILMMLGLTDPTSGSVKVCGVDSTSNPIEVKRKVGYLPEDVGFYEDRSGLENLVYTARLNGFSEKQARKNAEELLARVGLTDAKDKKAGKYSRGMRQRLGLADVLIKKPEVIILDEPTLGIDPEGVKELLELIAQLNREEKLTVLLSSHHLYQVQQICDRVGLFVNGKLIADGDIQSLSQKLFSTEPFLIEAGISYTDSVRVLKNATKDEHLRKMLMDIEGVTQIDQKKDKIYIGCSNDVSPQIAKAIVESGVELCSLRRKEYGLDDIYHHYFEGGMKI